MKPGRARRADRLRSAALPRRCGGWRLGALLGIVYLAVVAGPASARAHVFSKPFSLGHSGGIFGEGPGAAADRRGDVILAWVGDGRHGRQDIQIVFRRAPGKFTRARTIFTTNGGLGSLDVPRVAIDGAGNALVAFTEFTLDRQGRERAAVVKAVYRTARGRLSPAQTVSPPKTNGETPAVAMASSGQAVVVFQRDRPFHPLPYGGEGQVAPPDAVMAAARAPGHPFGPATAISAPAARAQPAVDLTPRVTMTSSGEAIAAWSRAEHGSVAIETSVRPPGGAFGPPALIGIGDDIQPVVLAGDPSGDTVLVWTSGPRDRPQLDASYRQAGTPFSTRQVLDSSFDFEGTSFVNDVQDLSATVDARGTAAVVWLQSDPGACNGGTLLVSRHPAGGEFSAGQKMRNPRASDDGNPYGATGPSVSLEPSVAAFGANRFITVWQQMFADAYPDGACGSADLLSFATATPDSGPFGGPHLLDRFKGDFYNLSLVASPSGLVLAYWQELTNNQNTVTVRAAALGARVH